MAKRSRRVRGVKPGKLFITPQPPKQPAVMFRPHQFENTIEMARQQPRTVFLTRKVYSDIWHFVDIADKEVGWLGTVRTLPTGSLLIEEVFLLEQEVSAAQTEISEEGIALLAEELMQTRENGVEVANSIRFWGHSHVNMGTAASPQDENQMKLFQENGCPWFIRGIFNKLGRMEFDIFLFESGVIIRDVPWAVYDNIDFSGRESIEAEFKEKVRERVYVVPKHPKYPLAGYDEDNEELGFPKLTSLGHVRFGDQIVLNSELGSSENEDEEAETIEGGKSVR